MADRKHATRSFIQPDSLPFKFLDFDLASSISPSQPQTDRRHLSSWVPRKRSGVGNP